MTASRESALIVGAGPAGCLAAIRLIRAGVDVRLIDRGRHPAAIGETLSPEGRRALSRAGLWDRVPAGVALRCSSIVTAWERSSTRSRSFLTNPYGPAWHLDRERFDAWLVAEAVSEGVELVVGTARNVTRTDKGWSAVLDGGTVLGARFLVLATGRTGTLPTQLARRTRLDSLCVAGGYADAVGDAGETLLVEAVPSGWWYSMPVPDGRLFTGWMTDASLLASGDRRSVVSAAHAETTYTRARVRVPSGLVVRSAMSAALEPSVGDDWIAVGDAAVSRDPLSGDGLAAALRFGWDGAGAIVDAINADQRAWIVAREQSDRIAAEYRRVRSSAYRAQPRWTKQPFWSARRM